jgi:lipopolysaccharide export LptBFGC system permease protein LptF
MPDQLGVVLPVALLLALLYALTNHARHHELTAIRAAGVSLWRLCMPYWAVGLVCSLFLYLLNEQWAPNTAELAEQIRTQHLRNPSGAGRTWQNDLQFRNDHAGRFWRIRSYNIETGEMLDPYVEWGLRDGSRRHLLAERGVWTNDAWVFFNAQQSVPNPSPASLQIWEQTNRLVKVEFTETPDQIKSEIKVSQLSRINRFKAAKKVQLSVAEITHYKRLHPHLRPADRALLDTQLYARLASPWTCLVVVVIAVPFGAPSGRRNVFVGVASSIFIGFAYFVLQRFGMVLGTGQHLSPLLAALSPNLLFGCAGLWLIARVR